MSKFIRLGTYILNEDYIMSISVEELQEEGVLRIELDSLQGPCVRYVQGNLAHAYSQLKEEVA